MTGFVILFCWLALAMIFVAFGKLCESKTLIGIGAVMLLMLCMVGDVSY